MVLGIGGDEFQYHTLENPTRWTIEYIYPFSQAVSEKELFVPAYYYYMLALSYGRVTGNQPAFKKKKVMSRLLKRLCACFPALPAREGDEVLETKNGPRINRFNPKQDDTDGTGQGRALKSADQARTSGGLGKTPQGGGREGSTQSYDSDIPFEPVNKTQRLVEMGTAAD
jgi:hypothetical protein